MFSLWCDFNQNLTIKNFNRKIFFNDQSFITIVFFNFSDNKCASEYRDNAIHR